MTRGRPRDTSRARPGPTLVRHAIVLAFALACAHAAALASAGPAAAQASPFVPQDHWSLDAARRLHGLGLMPPGYDPGLSVQLVGVLREAFTAAAAESALAAAYAARLAEELGDGSDATAAPDMEPRLSVSSWVELGYRGETGRLFTGTGYTDDRPWSPPTPMDPVSAPAARVRHLGSFGPLAWGAAGGVVGSAATLTEAYVLGGWGGVGLWGGVRSAAFTTAPGTGVVLESLVPRPGLGAHLLEPVTLPWLLRHLGPVQATTMFVRARRNHAFEHPWIWATRIAFEPHPRLRLGVNRAIMMGGEGNEALTLRYLAYILIGKHTGAYDNQLVSATFRYRPPVGDLPLVAYLEWGLEDSAGAWKNVPGLMGGLELASLPFAPTASAGVAATWFARSCCGNPVWYRNWAFQGGWSDDGRLLGHALGGHGREVRGYGRVDLADARAQLTLDAFARRRGDENVFAPTREGGSVGGAVGLELVASPSWRLHLSARGETASGGGWREGVLDVGVRATP